MRPFPTPAPAINRVGALAALVLLAVPACGDDTDGASVGDAPWGGVDAPGGGFGGSPDGGDDSGPEEFPLDKVDTLVAVTTVTAGEPFEVLCVALDPDDQFVVAVEATMFDVQLSPGEGVTVTPSGVVDAEGRVAFEVVATKAGPTYIACQVQATPDVEPSNDSDVAAIDVGPGPMASAFVTLTTDAITVAETLATECEVGDVYGNRWSGGELRIEPDLESNSIFGTTFETKLAGDYVARCASGEVLSEGAPFTVAPGAPTMMVLATKPGAGPFKVDQAIQIFGQATDAYGNPVGALPVTIASVTPGTHHTVGEAGGQTTLRFDVEGVFDVEVYATDVPELTGYLVIGVDELAPVIVVEQPPRGYVADGALGVEAIILTGTVTDNLGVLESVTLNGQFIDVNPDDGTFNFSLPVDHGIYPLHFVARDAQGLETETARSVLHAAAWYPLTTPTVAASGVDDAIVAELGGKALDDGVHDLSDPNDLATLATALVAGFDLTEALDDPLTTFGCIGGDCAVVVDAITLADPDLSLESTPGALRVTATLADLEADIVLEAPCDIPIVCPSNPLPLPGTLSATAIVVQTDLTAAVLPSGELDVEATNTTTSVEGFALDINDPTGLLQGVIDSAVGFVEPVLIGAIELALPPVLEAQLASALTSLADALALDTELPIPAFADGLEGNTISLQSQLTDLVFGTDAVTLRLDAVAFAQQQSRPYPVPGSPAFAGSGCGEEVWAPTSPPVEVRAGIHDDLVNQLLFGLWEGGTLNVSLDEVAAAGLDLGDFGITLSGLTVDALLPPMLDGCQDDALLFRLGDLYLEASLDLLGSPSQVAFWLNGAAPVTVVPSTVVGESGLDTTQLTLDIGDFDPLVLDVVTNVGFFEGDDEGLVDLVRDALLPQLLDLVAADAAIFELPTLALSDLIEGSDSDTVIQIGVDDIGRLGPYVRVTGGLD